MEFTFEEKTDMLSVYAIAGRNASEAAREYELRYPNRRAPHRTYFGRLERSLRLFGRFDKLNLAYLPELLETTILSFVFAHEETSLRETAKVCGCPHSTVMTVLRKHGLHPFKFCPVQRLRPGDAGRRRMFCQWFLDRLAADPQIWSKILWTDESFFSNCGFFNRKNTHYWSEENLRVFQETKPQARFSFNVWCGMLGARLLGPHIYHGTLNGQMYRDFITDELLSYLEDMPLNVRQELIFMQDGAPPHNARATLTLLRGMFPEKVLATNGDIRWPARSPDLTPLDFFLWGRLKDVVYSHDALPHESVDDLRSAVESAIANLPRREVRNATRAVVRRCRLCLEQNGSQFEHLL